MHIRRLRGFVAVTFATVLALSACATENDNGTSSTEQPSTSTPSSASPTGELLPAAEGTTTYPYVISTQWGETTLEERPERIAVLGFSSNSDVLQALDVIPVYAMTEDGDFEWKSQEWLDAVEFTDTATRRDPINFEGVAGTNPDLIVIHNWLGDQADYDRLATIAPVLDHAVSDRDALDWRADQRLIGEALDLSAAAEKVIADADARVAEIAAAHPEFEGKTVTIATEYDAGLSYYTFPGGPAEAALLDLGFVPNPLAQELEEQPGYVENNRSVSEENFQKLDADYLIVLFDGEANKADIENSALFQAIPAVADGRYLGMNADVWDEERTETGMNATWVYRRGASALSVPWAAEVLADKWLTGITES